MLVDSARKYLGVKFHHQGRGASEMDCIGLLITAAKDIGLQFPDMRCYSPKPSGNILQRNIESSGLFDKIPAAEYTRNDLLVFVFNEEPQHVGLCCGDSVIHSYFKAGKVIEHRLNSSWRSKLASVYRLKEGLV